MPDAHLGIPVLEIFQRLLAAVLAGGLVGWNRERLSKPAGLRTHMLVTLGSATFCLIAFEVGAVLSDRYGDGLDPMRVLQGVVGGIGFLGAGSIIQSRGHVHGVTTAAGVWMAGSLGAACGLGAYRLAALSTVLAILILTVAAKFEALMRRDAAPAREETSSTPPGPRSE